MNKTIVMFCLVCGICCTVFSQYHATLVLKNKSTGIPITDALVDIKQDIMTTDSLGQVIISYKTPESYSVLVKAIGFNELKTTLHLTPKKQHYTLFLNEKIEQLAEVVIHSKQNKKLSKIQAIENVTQNSIHKTMPESLAKSLTNVQGVSMIQSGNMVAKPVIQGMYGERIIILNNGVYHQSQDWGVDHAPEIDPLMADKITVIKGSESVRFGSNALGGIIAITPEQLPYQQDRLSGKLSTGFASNGQATVTHLKLKNSIANTAFAYTLQGTIQSASDSKTAEYYLNNTGIHKNSLSIATGIHNKQWKAEVFYDLFDSENGVFFGSHIGNLNDLQLRFQKGRPSEVFKPSSKIAAPKQKVLHQQLTLKSDYQFNDNSLLAFQYAYQQDNRKEYSVRRLNRTSIPALSMLLKTHSSKLELSHTTNNWKTVAGANIIFKNNFNEPGTGVVPLIPNYASLRYALFFTEHYKTDTWSGELGTRYDYEILNADGYDINAKRYGATRKFNNLTFTAGTALKINTHTTFKANIGYALRSPSVGELYSNGLHHSSGSYVIGSEQLQPEKSLKLNTRLTVNLQRLRLQTDWFVQRIFGYIYDTPTSETRTLFSGVFPVFEYQQSEAFFRGMDAKITYHMSPSLTYELAGSVLWADDLKNNSYFPFIAPPSLSQEISLKKFLFKNTLESFDISASHQ